jgi:hypothetical protein
MDHYPVDNITKKTSYEMHVPIKNISMKVAVGYVLPSGPRQTWQAAKGTQQFLLIKITRDHFLGEDLVHIEFDEFFQLFNPDALDKSLVSAYVL